MAKVSTESIKIDDDALQGEGIYKYDVNVDKEGTFSTTLPKDLVALMKEANIDLARNRMKTEGYVSSSTLDGLKQRVKELVNEYKSRELISEKIIIEYSIQTQCSYAKTLKGEICPNPSEEYTKMEYDISEPRNVWINGTLNIDATHNSPFGFQIYACPYVRRDYKYKSGKEKTEYSRMCYGGEIAHDALEKGYYLKWLNDVPCINEVKDAKIEELDYTENVAMFFVNMIKSICNLNEKIKDFLHPDKIKLIAEEGQKLLG